MFDAKAEGTLAGVMGLIEGMDGVCVASGASESTDITVDISLTDC